MDSKKVCNYCGTTGATTPIHTYQTFHNGRVALTTNYPITTTYYHSECYALKLQGK